ncbi:MAG: hypothetical protein ACKVUT_14515 [Gaiella sp.]
MRNDDFDEDEREPPDDRPPICPACGVTMGVAVSTGDHVCLECGFPEEGTD